MNRYELTEKVFFRPDMMVWDKVKSQMEYHHQMGPGVDGPIFHSVRLPIDDLLRISLRLQIVRQL